MVKLSNKKFLFFALMASLPLIFMNSCAKDDPGYGLGGGDLPTHYMLLKDGAISPSVLTVVAGNTITFLNQTNEVHQIVSSDSITFNTGLIQPNKFYTWSKDIDGTFEVHCVQHPNVRATITLTP